MIITVLMITIIAGGERTILHAESRCTDRIDDRWSHDECSMLVHAA